MQLLRIVLNINCFTSNSSIVLSAQTKQATFTVQVLRDNSQDMNICKQLDSSAYNVQVILGNYIYKYPTQLVYSSNNDLEIVFPCLTIDDCNDAFQASTASFQLLFPSSNTEIADSVSNFNIERYNRQSCIIAPYISANLETSEIEIFGSDNGCNVPFEQTKQAIITLTAYPDFKLSKIISLSGIYSVQDLLLNLKINCNTDYVKTQQRTCKRLVNTFVSSINSYAELTIDLPGEIPNSVSNMYDRISSYSLFTEIITISSSFVQQFDCFDSEEMIFFTDMIRLTLPVNSSQIHCQQPIKQFIGDFDKTQYILQVQSNVNFLKGQVVTFNFTNVINDLTQTKPWLSCDFESNGRESCKNKLKQVDSMATRYTFISRTFYKNNQVVQTFQTSSTSRFAKIINAYSNISRTQFCFHTTDLFSEKTELQVRVQLVGGAPQYSEEHDQVLDIRGQIDYPNAEQLYCMNYELDDTQFAVYDYLVDRDDVTGLVSFYGTQIAVYQVTFTDENPKTNYMYIAVFSAIFVTIVWFSITMYLERNIK
ncbi:Conserved_hypothetical protein [Hexamita inflata]|uniref:Transmembrane protein n=1 Tax=Hexamita inflata TaxID=28002 RepID=A0AA86P9X7_9EUKA|nr:Conserved hypothetical protein [Hexamita inflata]